MQSQLKSTISQLNSISIQSQLNSTQSQLNLNSILTQLNSISTHPNLNSTQSQLKLLSLALLNSSLFYFLIECHNLPKDASHILIETLFVHQRFNNRFACLTKGRLQKNVNFVYL